MAERVEKTKGRIAAKRLFRPLGPRATRGRPAIDGLLVGYGNIAPELLLDLLAAGKAGDWKAARAAHDRMLPVTKAVYHRGSHMEGTVALKIALRARGVLPNAVVRSPLVDLTPEAEQEIADAMKAAGLA